MNADDVRALLDEIDYPGYGWRLGTRHGRTSVAEPAWLQVAFEADGALQHGRKWRLSPWMTKSEIVQTAFAAVLAAVEHEAREHFLYRGQPVFGPHFDVDALWTAAFQHQLDVRPVPA